MRQLLITAFVLLGQAAAAGELQDAVKAGDLARAAQSVSDGADVNEVDYLAGSPLHIAALRGELEMARMLLDAGADLENIEFGNGQTALHWAALGGQPALISLLAEAGADLDARSDSGATPLHIAADNRKPEAMRRLLALGADATARLHNGQSVMYRAGRKGLFNIVDLLRKNGASPPDPEDVKPYLASADPARGAELFAMLGCRQCHYPPELRQIHPYGPSLWGIVGAKKAGQEDYREYTDAFQRLDGVWDYDSLNRLLTDASDFAPGTDMDNDYDAANVTVPRVEDRADIIAFLRLQADELWPLP